jgi:hypothetical protein
MAPEKQPFDRQYATNPDRAVDFAVYSPGNADAIALSRNPAPNPSHNPLFAIHF